MAPSKNTSFALALTSLLALAAPAAAASSKFCEGGSWTVLGVSQGPRDGRFGGDIDYKSADVFKVQGKFLEFKVDPATFAVYDWAFVGKGDNVGDMTGGRYTPVWASRVPDHRGLSLTSAISVELRDEVLKLSRSGPGLSVSISAKDCAQGGIFQAEPERADNASTRFVHTLAPGAFHYDNPTFRADLGKYLGGGCASEQTGPPGDACVRVSPRVNIGRDDRAALVLRDSSQVARRVAQPGCGPDFANALGLSETKDYCGGVAVWDVASGGRMGAVTGGDATEVANPPTNCLSDCKAENQVQGKLAVLGFPATVPEEVRLTSRTSESGLDKPLAVF
ncbi:hypothetical protein GGTG_08365 [Gaeumannomyces tritici R3-111a-1]|uniref:Uncharacterized protein n=1 Tax=Gaeumannomyces tritici (strain R3-111a-1) TaxID=644352 RepID=J3P4C9_GAET3|nr:hypothetical protein GGTG_08365 [Gaeumannomyces tritici R3-111a-1]EJT74525.1 hypothetical protein GGTG_08365 [Gaeumannomyces tritici R3-111a-1]